MSRDIQCKTGCRQLININITWAWHQTNKNGRSLERFIYEKQNVTFTKLRIRCGQTHTHTDSELISTFFQEPCWQDAGEAVNLCNLSHEHGKHKSLHTRKLQFSSAPWSPRRVVRGKHKMEWLWSLFIFVHAWCAVSKSIALLRPVYSFTTYDEPLLQKHKVCLLPLMKLTAI